MSIRIAPSLLSCDFSEIKKECARMEEAGADWLHLDVMDGAFVPNISFGIPIVAAIRRVSSQFLDTHLMIERPRKYIDAFYKAGADALSIHVEASDDLSMDLNAINRLGIKSGIAINPETEAERIFDELYLCHHVCLMSVHPGFGGQAFIYDSLKKIERLKSFIAKNNLSTLIEVDGGITVENAKDAINAGADILVAGSAVFKSKDAAGTIAALRNA